MKTFENLTGALDRGVSLYAFGIAAILVIYMVVSLAVGGAAFLADLPDIVRSFSEGGISAGFPDQEHTETEILHTIAFAIVLIKAYTILMAYAKDRHVNLKYMMEISVIAPAIELLFNSHSYEIETFVLYAAFGTVNLLIYVVFFNKVRGIGSDEH